MPEKSEPAQAQREAREQPLGMSARGWGRAPGRVGFEGLISRTSNYCGGLSTAEEWARECPDKVEAAKPARTSERKSSH